MYGNHGEGRGGVEGTEEAAGANTQEEGEEGQGGFHDNDVPHPVVASQDLEVGRPSLSSLSNELP